MEYSLILRTSAITICVFLFIGMILLFLLGRFLRDYRKSKNAEIKYGTEMIQTALYGLFAFILAIAFGMAGNRYNFVRDVMEDEANAIGTAILRSDLYSDSVNKIFRDNFREYLESRISAYSQDFDTINYKVSVERSAKAGEQLWKLAAQQSKLPNMLIPSNQMVPALNNMLDMASKRDTLAQTNIPDIVVYMLLIFALFSSFIAGLTSSLFGFKDWIIAISFNLLACMVIYITLDLGRPLRGFIRASAAEKSILDLRHLLE